MIGVIIVTHGALGQELINVAEHVVGKQQALLTINIGPEDDIEKRRQEIVARVAELGTLSAVARERDAPVSQVSRALSRIEAACGVRLVRSAASSSSSDISMRRARSASVCGPDSTRGGSVRARQDAVQTFRGPRQGAGVSRKQDEVHGRPGSLCRISLLGSQDTGVGP